MDNELSKKIEALLFWKAEPVKISDLINILNVDVDQVNQALKIIDGSLKNRGLIMVNSNNTVSLATDPIASELIERLNQEEINKDLSRATLETLAIILYRGPIRRSEIDFIRGVNSQSILRNLMIRGLIEKESQNNEQSYYYKPTIEALSYLGKTNVKDLPNYDKVNRDINNFIEANSESDES